MTPLTPTELLTVNNWRYATKVFNPTRKVSPENWQALQQSIALSPSSFGLQPWHFIVVSSPKLREELLPHSWGQKQVVDCSHYLVCCTRTDIDIPFIEKFIASTAEQRGVTTDSLKGYQDVVVDFVMSMTESERIVWSERQTYLALQRLMDSAALLEIDTCPIEGFVASEYGKILELPAKKIKASVCCAIGYRSEDDKYATLAKSRYPVTEIFTEV